ncbi:MAG: PAS domain-containing sensor histidine kinase [Bacteroidota bacterium]
MENGDDRYKEAEKIAQLGHWDLDIVNNKLYWSDQIYKIFELEPKHFGASYEAFLENVHPGDRDRVDKAYSNSLKNKTPYEIEHRILLKNEKLKYVREKCRTEYDKAGNPVRSIGMVLDITHQKKVELALKESEKQLTLANKNLLDERNIFMIGNVVVFKWQNLEGWPVEYVSQNVTNVFGYTPDDFINVRVKFSDLIHNEDVERVSKEVERAVDNNLDYFDHKEYRIINKSGDVVWLYDFTTILRNKKNETTHFYGYVKNVTDRKKAEEALKESEIKLRESNKTKDKFFSIIGHDLRSPFNTMLGFSSLLVDNFDKYDVQKQKKFLSILNKDIQNTYNLLENLLLWSRSELGIIDFVPEKENLYLLLAETLNLLNRSALDKSITLINKVSEGVYVKADKNMLLTILRNLISNAIKFTAKKGQIAIKARLVADENKQNIVEISVKDSGIGITKEKQGKLFKISEDILTKGTEDEAGIGLGLVLCKEFVEKQGGKIWVESDEGKGSEFVFNLPVG